MAARIPVIDIFAGPGGLGEGFAHVRGPKGPVFRIALSIEKDRDAHRTLETRSFQRQFLDGPPDRYYDYLRTSPANRLQDRARLLGAFPREAAAASQESWLATLGEAPDSVVSSRIRRALRGAERWVLLGGPPCQAYSMVGRSRMRPVLGDAFEADARHLLYQEYLQILAAHSPPIFVMENVKGLLSATLNGESMIDRILRDLEDPEGAVGLQPPGGRARYRVVPLTAGHTSDVWSPEDYVVRSELHGVPQARHRVILIGLRKDLTHNGANLQLPVIPKVTAGAVIDSLPPLRAGISDSPDGRDEWLRLLKETPDERWSHGAANGAAEQSLREMVLDRARRLVAELEPPDANRGSSFIEWAIGSSALRDWLSDSKIGGVVNHETRSHLAEDIKRYLFASTFASVADRSPRLSDFPETLLPAHRNVGESIGGTSLFSDRFRVQLRNRPSSTVTSHLSRDGHYYIHWDARQARSLTVREAARLQTFPDNYVFEGSRTSQYVQVGNAVPPYLAYQIGGVVAGLLR